MTKAEKKITIGIIALAISLVLKESSPLLLPLIILGDGCGGGGDGGGGGGGDGGGGGGDCSGGCGCGGGGDGGDSCGIDPGFTWTTPFFTSTPFLCTWNGHNYNFENDFLFGKPTSLFATKHAGINTYEKGRISGDVYKIQNPFELKNGRPSFQIKEIEPEESFIDYLSLARVVFPKNKELIVDSDSRFRIFDREAICSNEGFGERKIIWNGTDVAELDPSLFIFENESSKNEGRLIEPDKDEVIIEATLQNTDKDPYLILKSFYRDWTLGDLPLKKSGRVAWREMLTSAASPSDWIKTVALMAMVAIFSASSFLGSLVRTANAGKTINEASELVKIFGTKKASADIPAIPAVPSRSIVIQYWNGERYQALEIYTPRYYQMTTVAISIPRRAILEGGKVKLRLTATKKHKIGYIGLVAPSADETAHETETLQVAKAWHQREGRDYAHIVNTKQSGEYLHTIPADIVDLEFEEPKINVGQEMQEVYLLSSNGIYTNLSEESKNKAKNWIDKLDPESREWLYQMKSFQS